MEHQWRGDIVAKERRAALQLAQAMVLA